MELLYSNSKTNMIVYRNRIDFYDIDFVYLIRININTVKLKTKFNR